jgi:glutamate-5-semialdehyde dehydrogenase
MLEQMGAAAKAASYKLALLSSREKNRVLEKIADYLESQSARFCSPTSRI